MTVCVDSGKIPIFHPFITLIAATQGVCEHNQCELTVIMIAGAVYEVDGQEMSLCVASALDFFPN